MKSFKVIIAIIALSLAAGLFGGYRIWGTKEQGKADIKQLMHTLGEEVGRVEQKNQDLVASIEASKEEIQASEAIRKENQELKGQLQDALQAKTGLESSLAALRAKETDAKQQAAVEQELRTALENTKGRITALEKENRKLKSVIDNISEITQRKQEGK